MPLSRYSRIEEKRARRRLLWAIFGSLAIIAFLALFGMKILVGFSLFVDMLRGTPPAPAKSEVLILPPALDPLPVATFSSTLKITGRGQEGLTLILYLNDKEAKKIALAKNASFSAQLSGLGEGLNTISAKLSDEKGNMSELSNVLTTSVKKSLPILEITSPEDNATVTGETNTVTVSGKSEEDTIVTINGRVVVLRTDNSFEYQYPLSEGDNTLTIQATDAAGNATRVERKVTYHK
jgi:hypothetical protein